MTMSSVVGEASIVGEASVVGEVFNLVFCLSKLAKCTRLRNEGSASDSVKYIISLWYRHLNYCINIYYFVIADTAFGHLVP